jgi:hypothetical protein
MVLRYPLSKSHCTVTGVGAPGMYALFRTYCTPRPGFWLGRGVPERVSLGRCERPDVDPTDGSTQIVFRISNLVVTVAYTTNFIVSEKATEHGAVQAATWTAAVLARTA